MRSLRVCLLAAFLGLANPAGAGSSRWASRESLQIGTIEVLTENPIQWRRLELKAQVSGTFETPFDEGEIAVDAEVATHCGRTLRVPAFFY